MDAAILLHEYFGACTEIFNDYFISALQVRMLGAEIK